MHHEEHASDTHNVVPFRQGEVVLVVTLVLFGKQQPCGTLCMCLAEQGDGQGQRTKPSFRLGEDEPCHKKTSGVRDWGSWVPDWM